jgi:[glutamine synthetase] adenylyltransferase / [glutamine synthetase]-adenylyl-L-tyrosine phosphorylase
MFADESRAEELIGRICRQVNRPIRDVLWRMFEDWPNGDDGLARLNRIVGAMSGAGVFADLLEEMPEVAALFVNLVCTSRHMADILVQNPELVSLCFDLEVLGRSYNRGEVIEEGRRLVESARNYSHQLDRLRFLKQERTLVLAMQDIGGILPQPEIWRGVSELAIGLVSLAQEVAWRQFQGQGHSQKDCPLGIICMGKLGGLELNYSSDIDLIFVAEDDFDEDVARKYCELFRSAVAARMGRGDLYRVDLRLRPFGSQGPLVSRKSAIERYYDQYAEPWEHLALIRSFVIGDGSEWSAWWEGVRDRFAFGGMRSEMALSNLLMMRKRAEAEAEESDLKRGAGGIRDIELSVQSAQLVAGHDDVELRGRGTVDMLAVVIERGLVPEEIGRAFDEHYPFLRMVEHRVQLMDNRQVYALPENDLEREVVAHSLGFLRAAALEDELAARRREVRQGFNQIFEPLMGIDRSGWNPELDWVLEMKSGNEYRIVVEENESSRERLLRVSRESPAVISQLQQSASAMEQLLSGEIQEDVSATERFERLVERYDREEMARRLRNGWLRAVLRDTIGFGDGIGSELSRHYDAAIRVFASRWGSTSVLGLGSYAAGEMSPGSDADLLVLVEDVDEAAAAERSVQSALLELGKLRGLGVPFAVDFRLRPEGRNGRLVVTYDGLRKYAATFMDGWERFALGRCRVVVGDPKALNVVNEVVYGEKFSTEDFAALVHMKGRIERERVKPGMQGRHVKLGHGGIDDIQWLLQLGMFRNRERVMELAEVPAGTENRLRFLRDVGFLDLVEFETLREGWMHLVRVRERLYLMGIGGDLFPENPDKLAVLGREFGYDDPNEVLAMHLGHRQRIRGIFETGLERVLR